MLSHKCVPGPRRSPQKPERARAALQSAPATAATRYIRAPPRGHSAPSAPAKQVAAAVVAGLRSRRVAAGGRDPLTAEQAAAAVADRLRAPLPHVALQRVRPPILAALQRIRHDQAAEVNVHCPPIEWPSSPRIVKNALHQHKVSLITPGCETMCSLASQSARCWRPRCWRRPAQRRPPAGRPWHQLPNRRRPRCLHGSWRMPRVC